MQQLLFNPQASYSSKLYKFEISDLGKLHKVFPWDELAELLPNKSSNVGAKSWFDRRGMLALLFLKNYLKLSDKKLVERLNTDTSMQLFCFRLFDDYTYIKDITIVSRIRSYVASHIDFTKMQKILVDHWREELEDVHVLLMDASCYESDVRYPTDEKLLWECCEYVFEKLIFPICSSLGIKRPRNKYREQKIKHLSYAKRKKKSYKLKRKRIRALLYLLEKALKQLQEILNQNALSPSPQECKRLKTIQTVLRQQQYLYQNKTTKVDDRIVSLAKPWLRPIVRGKENKRVEFGLKVHVLQVGGISIIEYASHSAFHEGNRLKSSVLRHEVLFGKCTHIGADRIYATNANRSYCSELKILTTFPQKGRKTQNKDVKTVKSIISKKRATVMEGCFGTHKRNYNADKIRARTQKNEVCWLYFSIFTANSVKISTLRDAPSYYFKVA